MSKETLFFKDKPVFGLDIGNGSVKVMQIATNGHRHNVVGYGAASFSQSSITDGVITDIEPIAQAVQSLFKEKLIGDITTNRVIVSIPAAHVFNRSVRLPNLSTNELEEAINSEVERYVPIMNTDLYTDYTKLRTDGDESEYLVVATPKRVVDKRVELAKVLGLEIVGVQTTIDASGRMFLQSDASTNPTALIDFGSTSSDLTIYDQGLIVTGTVQVGGDAFTERISQTLNVSKEEAHIIKTKYGLGVSKKQKQIIGGLLPTLQMIIKEVKRTIRYYEERSGSEKKVLQIVTMGGGANMPGLSDYLTDVLRIPTRTCDPWQNLEFTRLQPPNNAEKTMYVTAAGLALTVPKELFTRGSA